MGQPEVTESTVTTEQRPLTEDDLGMEDRVKAQVKEYTQSAQIATEFQQSREERILGDRSRKDEEYQKKERKWERWLKIMHGGKY